MKKLSILLLLLGAFVQTSQAQFMHALTNPGPIVPNGESLEFKVELNGASAQANSYFVAEAPLGWTITAVTVPGYSPGYDISPLSNNTSYRIDFPSISGDLVVSVFMKPGCSIALSGDKAVYYYYSSVGGVLAQTTSDDISNVKAPVLVFTRPPDRSMQPTTEAYLEWTIHQTEAQAYIMGSDLKINVVSTPYSQSTLRILSVEYMTTSGWQPLAVTMAPNQLSYTYTFTTSDYMAIGGINKLTNNEVIRVREKVKYENCYNNNPSPQVKMNYTLTHTCPTVKLNNGETVVTWANAWPSGFSYGGVKDVRQTTPADSGQLVIRIQNLNNVAVANLFLATSYSVNPAWTFNVTSCYFSDATGVRDVTAPPITVNYHTSGSSCYIFYEFESSTPYKELQDVTGNGKCNDLTKAPSSSDYIYVTINWKMDFSTCKTCGNGGDTYLFNNNVYHYSFFSLPGCVGPYTWITVAGKSYSYLSNYGTNYLYSNMGFNNGTGAVANPVLVRPDATNPGTITTMTISDMPANTSYPNTSAMNNVTTNTHRVELTLPIDVVYTGTGVTVNGVAATNITWNASTRELAFQIPAGINGGGNTITTTMTYSFGVQVVVPAPGDTGAPSNRAYIKHTFDWDGVRYTYGCQTVTISYRLYIYEPCRTYSGGPYRVERTSFGYSDKTMATRYTSLAQAKAAGVDVNVFGPFDNVEFEFTGFVVTDSMTIDDGYPLYMDIGYRHFQSAANLPYFTRRNELTNGAILQYRLPGSSVWGDTIWIANNSGHISEIADGTGGYILRVRIDPYLKDAGGATIPRLGGTAFRVTLLARTTANLPNTLQQIPFLEANLYGIGSNGLSNQNDGCNMPVQNARIFNYQLTFPTISTNEAPPDVIYWNSGQNSVTSPYPFPYNSLIALKMSLNNNVSTQSEIFVNEFRPNAIINRLTFTPQVYSYYISYVVDKVWDSEGREFSVGTEYSVSYSNNMTPVALGQSPLNEVKAVTGEYFRDRDVYSPNPGYVVGDQSYYIFLKARPICGTMYPYVYLNNFSCTDFPTSATPVTRTAAATGVTMNRTYSGWNISTSTTQASISTGSRQFSWPLRITNTSTWVNTSHGANTYLTMPNIYLFIEIQEGSLDDLELYWDNSGVQTLITAPWEAYSGRPGYQSYWIKIGTMEGLRLNASTCYIDFFLRAKHPDCNVGGQVKLAAKFAVNTVTYPTNPYAGFTLYNQNADCRQDYPTVELKGEFLNMDFSGLINGTPTGVISPDKFELCKPATFTVSFINNLFAPVKDLEFKIYRTSSTALELDNPTTTMFYKKSNGASVPFDGTWTIDDSNEGYILIKLPSTLLLDPRPRPETGITPGTVGDLITVTFKLVPTCDFFFGSPIYVDVYGSSLCNVIEYKSIGSNNIRLDGYDEGDLNPSLAWFMINGVPGPNFTIPYTGASDGNLKLTGRIALPPNSGSSGLTIQAYIQMPPNMRLNSAVGSINTLYLDDGPPSSFDTYFIANPRNPSQLTANFTATGSSSTMYYNFEVDVQITNPWLWDCQPKVLTVGALVNIQMKCHPEDLDYCAVSNSVLSVPFNVTLKKNEADIVPNSVRFIESFDYTLNQHILTVKAKVRNLGSVELEDLNFYLYADNNQNAILDAGDTQVVGSVPITVTIPAYTTVDVEQSFSVDATEICKLILTLPKTASSGNNAYLCKESFEVGPLNYEMPLSYRICQQDGITLGDPGKPGYSYLWTGNDDLVKTYLAPDQAQLMLAFPLITTLGGAAQNRNFTLNLRRNVDPTGAYDCEENVFVSVYVEPKYSTWAGTNSVWENTENWNNGIPGKCTYVIIPENVPNYPILTRELNNPLAAKCDTIEFMHSGEVARTHLLDYNAAKVNLRLVPDRWYMLSSPLRYMYTGDYYVNGYDPNALTWGRTPDVWWMFYRMANPMTGMPYGQNYWSKPFNNLDEPMPPGKGLVVWVDVETNMTGDSDPTHKQSGRITPPPENYYARFTFPRLEDSYYYYNGAGFSDPRYTGPKQQGDRVTPPESPEITVLPRASIANSDSLRSRFTYEGLPSYNPATGSFTMTAHVYGPSEPLAMIGNPFMSHLSLNAFQTANNGLITTNFYVWSNRSTGFFEAVKLLNGNMDHITTTGGPAVIPPMQSFLVERQSTALFTTPFVLNANMSVTQPGDKLRSGSSILPLNVAIYKGGSRESAITLVYDENVWSNKYNASKDLFTLFPKEKSPVILYALANQLDVVMQAVSIHTFGELNKAIPLAIRTDSRGDLLTFSVTGLEAFAPEFNVYLNDTKAPSGQPLHNLRKDSTYTFTNFDGNIDEGRFYIQFVENPVGGGIPTGDKKASLKDFYVYSMRGMVHIYSESDPIEKIEVCNLQGQRIWMKDKIRNELFSFDMYANLHQAVIVRVLTKNGLRSVKLMIQ